MAVTVWIVLALVPVCVWGYTPTYKYLDENCNKTLKFSKDVVLEFSDFYTRAHAQKSFQVSFQNSDSSKRVQLHFRFLDIPQPSGCAMVGLTLSEGSTYLTPKNGICGTSRPSKNYKTTGNKVTIQLSNRDTVSKYVDFGVLLTSFYNSDNNSSCGNDDFLCNNGQCISNQLVCNGYNDCGDNTDEVEGCTLAAAVIVGIVFGVIIFVVMVSVLSLYVRRRRRAYLRITEDTQDIIVDHLQTLRAQYDMLELEQELLKRTVKNLQKRTQWQEDHLRRQNLLFFGIPRTATETHEQCEAKVYEVLRTEMGVTRTIPLERVQRVGSAVMVKFLTVRDKLHVLSHARNLRGRQVRVTEDFSKRVRDIRKGLMELKNTYMCEGKRAVLRFDKLYTDFDVFTYDLNTKTVIKADRGPSRRPRYMSFRILGEEGGTFNAPLPE